MYQLVLIFEFFHIVAHLGVLLRLTNFSETYLSGKKWYFLLDCFTPLMACYYIGYYPLLLLPHTIGHVYYIKNWNQSYYAIRIVKWSSAEYRGPYFTADFYLTNVDILSHVYVAYLLLSQHIQ